MTVVFIAVAGFVSWLVSTIGAGGGEFILIAAVAYLLSAQAVAPVVNLSNLLAVPSRVLLFRKDIDWAIVRWFLAGAVPGALVGAWLFTQTKAEWLQVFIAIFLLSAPLQYRFGDREKSFEMRLAWFLPAGLFVAFFSGLIGGMGPVLNPLYLNYGVVKEKMIGTKSFNSLVMHVIAIGTFTTLGAIKPDYVWYAVAVGVAAIFANWLGKRWLKRISEKRFRQLVVWLMVVSGLVMLWQQRAVLHAATFDPSPHAFEVPAWFKSSFLDFREDVAEAAKGRKRVIVYFGQDGCRYCRELMRVNFSQKEIAEKTRRHFDAIALNIWGDREVLWPDRKLYTEKSLAGALKVQFTPTLLFFDERGNIVLRLNGYYPPHKFSAALDYVAGHHELRVQFAAYLAQNTAEQASGRLHDEPFFMRPPYDLTTHRRDSAKPLAVFFEQKECAACDELHRISLKQKPVRALLDRFDVVRLELFGSAEVVTADGQRSTEADWGQHLNVAYTPSIVFFDRGKEVFRVEGYLRPFHLESALEYVASSIYRKEPSFQRYVQGRAQKIRQAGGKVELW